MAALRRAYSTYRSASTEFFLIGMNAHARLASRVGTARRVAFISMLPKGAEHGAALAAFDEEIEPALDDAVREVNAAGARVHAAYDAVDAALQRCRDAVAAAGARRQGRSGGGLQEKQDLLGVGGADGASPVRAAGSPLTPTPGVGERAEAGCRAEWLEAGRRVRAAAGRVPRQALLAEGGRGGWLESAGGAGPMPAAWARLCRVWGARGRRRRRCALGLQQVGQPPGRPPGCHRGAGCLVGRGMLGRGPWLWDGG